MSQQPNQRIKNSFGKLSECGFLPVNLTSTTKIDLNNKQPVDIFIINQQNEINQILLDGIVPSEIRYDKELLVGIGKTNKKSRILASWQVDHIPAITYLRKTNSYGIILVLNMYPEPLSKGGFLMNWDSKTHKKLSEMQSNFVF